MTNLINFKIFNPIFLIKLANLNVLVRVLRLHGEFHIQYMDLSGEESILCITVLDDKWLINAGIRNSIIKNIHGKIVHETVFQGVSLRWSVYQHITLTNQVVRSARKHKHVIPKKSPYFSLVDTLENCQKDNKQLEGVLNGYN